MLILIDIDWEITMIKFQSIAPTEQEFQIQLEMDGQLLMEIKVLSQIITQIHSTNSKLDLKLSLPNSELLV